VLNRQDEPPYGTGPVELRCLNLSFETTAPLSDNRRTGSLYLSGRTAAMSPPSPGVSRRLLSPGSRIINFLTSLSGCMTPFMCFSLTSPYTEKLTRAPCSQSCGVLIYLLLSCFCLYSLFLESNLPRTYFFFCEVENPRTRSLPVPSEIATSRFLVSSVGPS